MVVDSCAWNCTLTGGLAELREEVARLRLSISRLQQINSQLTTERSALEQAARALDYKQCSEEGTGTVADRVAGPAVAVQAESSGSSSLMDAILAKDARILSLIELRNAAETKAEGLSSELQRAREEAATLEQQLQQHVDRQVGLEAQCGQLSSELRLLQQRHAQQQQQLLAETEHHRSADASGRSAAQQVPKLPLLLLLSSEY